MLHICESSQPGSQLPASAWAKLDQCDHFGNESADSNALSLSLVLIIRVLLSAKENEANKGSSTLQPARFVSCKPTNKFPRNFVS